MTNVGIKQYQQVEANAVFSGVRREFTPEFKAMVVREYEAGATRWELAKKYDIRPHYVNRWQDKMRKATQALKEEQAEYKAQVIAEHAQEVKKEEAAQSVQEELQALRTENKALKTLLKMYMK